MGINKSRRKGRHHATSRSAFRRRNGRTDDLRRPLVGLRRGFWRRGRRGRAHRREHRFRLREMETKERREGRRRGAGEEQDFDDKGEAMKTRSAPFLSRRRRRRRRRRNDDDDGRDRERREDEHLLEE